MGWCVIINHSSPIIDSPIKCKDGTYFYDDTMVCIRCRGTSCHPPITFAFEAKISWYWYSSTSTTCRLPGTSTTRTPEQYPDTTIFWLLPEGTTKAFRSETARRTITILHCFYCSYLLSNNMPRILSRTALPNMKRVQAAKRNLNTISPYAAPRSQLPTHAGDASSFNLLENLSLYDTASSASSYYNSKSSSPSSTPPHQHEDVSSTDDWGQYVDVSVHLTVSQSSGSDHRANRWEAFFSWKEPTWLWRPLKWLANPISRHAPECVYTSLLETSTSPSNRTPGWINLITYPSYAHTPPSGVSYFTVVKNISQCLLICSHSTIPTAKAWNKTIESDTRG